jgi:alpha-1,3-rhamnosyl/mannosyltransferase
MAHSAIAPERITAVSLGVSPTFKQHSMAELRQPLEKYGLEKSSYILCVSTIEPRKKIRELLNAWRALPSSVRSKIRLVVAGGGGWLNSELLEELQGGMDGSVQYLGYVPEKELPALYAGAALFVYPSSYEGFGLPPVEAMASGVPVIVSNRSCLPEVTKGVAMVIDPDDIDAFALALQQGLTDQPWRAQAVAEGLEVASSYTWDRCAIQTRDVYQKVFDGRE